MKGDKGTLTIRDIGVSWEITRDEILDTHERRSRIVFVECSCESKRWGRRTNGHSLNALADDPRNEEHIAEARQQCAEALVKEELGEIPDYSPGVLGIRIHGTKGKPLNTIASLDLNCVQTRISADIVDWLGLQPTGRNFLEQHDGGINGVPTFSGNIEYWKHNIEVEMLPTNMGFPCVLGAGFVASVLGQQIELLYDAIGPEHIRVLNGVARCKKHYALIIGKYGESRTRLGFFSDILAASSINPILMDDLPDIEEQSLPEKLITLASMSRFVLADDHLASGHISELEICSERRFTTAILRQQGRQSTFMQADIADSVQFMKVFEYEGDLPSESIVRQAVLWANNTVQSRAESLNRKFNWRTSKKGVVRVRE